MAHPTLRRALLLRVSIGLVALAGAAGCIHATGHLPSGPPPEYEETPAPPAGAMPTSNATATSNATPSATATPNATPTSNATATPPRH